MPDSPVGLVDLRPVSNRELELMQIDQPSSSYAFSASISSSPARFIYFGSKLCTIKPPNEVVGEVPNATNVETKLDAKST